MVEGDDDVRCPKGDMSLSPKMREYLTEAFITDVVSWDVKPASFQWGGSWFCPRDGSRMIENDGVVRCPACERVFPGPLMHQLTELHVHRT